MTATDEDRSASSEDVRGLAGALELQVTPAAESLDGLAFTFTAPVSFPLRAGGYVMVETSAGSKLAQIRELHLDRVEGPDIAMNVGTFRDVHTRFPFDQLAGSGTMLDLSEPFHATGRAPHRRTAGSGREVGCDRAPHLRPQPRTRR